MSKCMKKLISSTNACMLVIMPLHHAMSPCHISMPCHHATSACHLACHAIMPLCDWSILYRCHVSSFEWFHVIMFVQYGCHMSPCQWCHVAPLFAKFDYWPYRTERDNFLIWSPLEVKWMPLESSWWALRSGATFANIGGLWKFGLPGSSWIKGIYILLIMK